MTERGWGQLLLLHPLRSLSANGGLSVPYVIGRRIGSKGLLAPALDPCLGLYSESGWSELVQALGELPDVRHEVRLLSKAIQSNTYRCAPTDSQIEIPERLRRLARLEDRVLMAVARNHIQIWNPDVWIQYRLAESLRIDTTHDVA